MIITEQTKRTISFQPHDAKRVGEGCSYLDQIVWLNGDRIELGDGVAFNYGCYVNGFGGLVIGDGAIFGPYTMIHTANHRTEDVDVPSPSRAGRSPRRCRSAPSAGSGWACASFPASGSGKVA